MMKATMKVMKVGMTVLVRRKIRKKEVRKRMSDLKSDYH